MNGVTSASYVIDELTDRINMTGWKLQPPTAVTVKNFDEAAKIMWTDPEDIVVNGGIAAEWDGTLVVRKVGSAPATIEDGTIVVDSKVKNQYKETPYIDTNLTNGTTYYYGIFPYTKISQYNLASVTEFTPGEIVPVKPVIDKIKSEDTAVKITFTSETPEAMVKIVYKKDSAPTTISDGTVVSGITSSPVEITGLTNLSTYYFVAYAYTALRVSDASDAVSCMPRAYIAYAMHVSDTESDPASKVTYPAGYDNSNFADTSYMDFTNNVFHLGDYANAFFMPRSCMLKYDGTVAYYLNESDETKREDGTASDITDTSFGGNAMMEWGQNDYTYYWKIVPDADDNGFTFVVATAALDDDMKPWNFYDANGNVTKHFYTPKYFGSSDGTRMRSLSGKANYANGTTTNEVNLANANNPTGKQMWYTEVDGDYVFIAMLLTMMCKSTSSQEKFGYGRCSTSNTAAINTGTMNGKGMFWGDKSQTNGVKVFGMENFWGNVWRRIAGYLNVSGTIKVKLTWNKQDGSTVVGYNQTGDGYVAIGTIAGSLNGAYISKMNINKLGFAPKAASGADNTYYCDGAWSNNSQTNYALVGGGWAYGLPVGLFCVGLDSASSSTRAYVGAALSCKPLAS